MAVTFDITNFNKSITDGITNSGIPSESESEVGIKYGSLSDAVIMNKFFYNISSAIQYIQTNGSILWQKDKEYPLGSLVNVLEFKNNSYIIRKFICSNVDPQTNITTTNPLIGTLNIDPNKLVTYVSTVSGIDSHWTEILTNESKLDTVLLPERQHGLSLFDIPNEGYYRNNFTINIKRFNSNTSDYDFLSFTIDFTVNNYMGNANNIMVNVYNVYCNNYNRTSVVRTPVNGYYNPDDYEYIFGESKYTPLGIFLSVNDNKLNLNVYSDDFSYIDDTKDIEVVVKSKISNINFDYVRLTQAYDVKGNNIILLRNGFELNSSDCGYIIESPVKYTAEEQFKRGLLMITEDNCIRNNSTRPGLSKPFYKEFDPDKTINLVSNASVDYSQHRFPLMKGEYSSSGYNILFYDRLEEHFDEIRPNTYSKFFDSVDCLFGYKKDVKINKNVRVTANWPTNAFNNVSPQFFKAKCVFFVNHGDYDTNVFSPKHPELNIFNPRPALYPKSKRVYRYFKY